MFDRILSTSMKYPADKFSLMFLFSIFSKKGEISEIKKQPPQLFYKNSFKILKNSNTGVFL